MQNPSELTPYEQAQLGSICARHAEIAFNNLECLKAEQEDARRQLLDIRMHIVRNSCDPEDFEYTIQDYEEYIQSLEYKITTSETNYNLACEQALKYAGINTLGAFVLTVLSQKEASRYVC